MAAVTGFVIVVPVRAQTACVPRHQAIAILIDVSGSVAKRTPGWYDALRGVTRGIVSGTPEWRSSWKLAGPAELLDSLAALGAADFAVVPFGTAKATAPYFPMNLETTASSVARAQLLDAQFPPQSAFSQGKTFVSLARAAVTKQLAAAGVVDGYLVVVSDFEQDASLTFDQRRLVADYDAQSLGLWDAGKKLTLQASHVSGIDAVVTRLMSAATPAIADCNPQKAPTAARPIRLTRPNSEVDAGRVIFEWTAVPGATTYLFELTARDSRNSSRQIVVSSPRVEVSDVKPGSYRWSVTARNGSLQALGNDGRALQANGGGGAGAFLLMMLLAVGVAAVVWLLRRRRARAPAR